MKQIIFAVALGLIADSLRAASLSGFHQETKPGFIQEFTRDQYRAAVYEHAVITPVVMATNHDEAVSQMMVNLREYEKQAGLAGMREADILVFPEDGIYGFIRDHDHMRHYIEDIPDPNIYSWTPCDEQTRFPQRLDVVIFLSCIAKNNSLYLVANYGDAKACSKADPNCPSDWQYQFNTDLAFDRRGQLIAKYHKQNLYYENQFDEPIVPEYAYFDTEFGRFGMFTCFDILFHEPMIPLITQYNITDVAFPTAWMDVMPFYSAIGYHSSVAMAYNVNLLSANIHLPLFRFQGSGIYTPIGTNTFYYDRNALTGKLLISDVAIIQNTKRRSVVGQQEDLKVNTKRSPAMPTPQRGINIHKQRRLNKPATGDGVTLNKQTLDEAPLMSVVFKDWYHIVLLNESFSKLRVCQRGLCCVLEYETNDLKDLYAFGVFNGKHKEEGEYYLQVCLLFTCPSDDVNTCGQSTFSAKTKFTSFRISGSFETSFVTPQTVLSDKGQLRLPRKGLTEFKNGQLSGHDDSYPLLEASLFGRFYERD